MRKFIAVIAAAAVILSLAGCWDMEEINKRVYVVGIGIDLTDNPGIFDYTFESTVIGSEVSYKSTTVSADSLAQAVQMFNKSAGHTANFEHLSCVIIGRETAQAGFMNHLDFLLRLAAVRRQSRVAAASGKAKELISAGFSERGASAAVADVLESADPSLGGSAAVTLQSLYVAKQNGAGYYLYEVSLSPSQSLGTVSSADSVSSGDLSYSFVVSGALSFSSKNYSGRLDSGQTELLRLLDGGQTSGIIATTDANSAVTYYRVESSRCFKSCEIDGGKMTFSIALQMECSLVDAGGSGGLPENYSKAEAQIESSVFSQMQELLELCRLELGAAPTGLDTTVRQTHFGWYSSHTEDFEALFSQSVIELNVSCHLIRTGALNA